MQTYYRKRAGVYDSSMGYDKAETVSSLQPVLDVITTCLSGKDVLEVACGPAFWTHFVSQHAKSIIATDYSEETLIEARKKSFDFERVSFHQADAYNLPKFSRSFSGCLAVDWFCHVPIHRINGFLSDLHRQLSPEAMVIFCDQLPKESSMTGHFDDMGNHLQSRSLPDGSQYSVIKNFFSESQITALFLPHSQNFSYQAFPECRRYIISYTPRQG